MDPESMNPNLRLVTNANMRSENLSGAPSPTFSGGRWRCDTKPGAAMTSSEDAVGPYGPKASNFDAREK
ncbi:hypothetical protein Nepgr_032013 [Nepenthes gracilis]|uniref:Uncharacterized protein n=1 Tax=Nepenthes gracilis TaxID=150966 RepID=A0AAD3THU0_NEPGR|nr:hypothetical protein Nepgr_032013 [Nepenthes gracilis]